MNRDQDFDSLLEALKTMRHAPLPDFRGADPVALLEELRRPGNAVRAFAELLAAAGRDRQRILVEIIERDRSFLRYEALDVLSYLDPTLFLGYANSLTLSEDPEVRRVLFSLLGDHQDERFEALVLDRLKVDTDVEALSAGLSALILMGTEQAHDLLNRIAATDHREDSEGYTLAQLAQLALQRIGERSEGADNPMTTNPITSVPSSGG